MSIVNLQRDALFVAPEKTQLNWPAGTNIGEGGFCLANADPSVYDAYSSARSSMSASTTVSSIIHVASIGLFLQPPGVELTPYRVKCYTDSDAPATLRFALIIGYAEDPITGTNDEITHWSLYGFTKSLDELILVEPAVAVGSSPIYFGICTRGAITAGRITASISVQRLATSPPQFSQSVS